MIQSPILTDRETWLERRKALLSLEKQFSHKRDELADARRSLPWVRIETDYKFMSTEGSVSLADLFGSHRQLVVYHFMFASDWDEGCKSCSFFSDSFDKSVEHLSARDTAFACISKAPAEKLESYRTRMGWSFNWVSAEGTSFGEDFGVSFPDNATGNETYNYRKSKASGELPGLSVFCRLEDGGIAHAYSTYSRGLDILNVAYNILDHTPLGRNEDGLEYTMSWVQRRGQYQDT
jgi:predicted dithiol-disulfide oxidoreductase (DUF899 family)